MGQSKPTAKGRSTNRKSGNGAAQDALELLRADHRNVQKMFRAFEKLKENGEDDEKEEIARQICSELTVHAQIEEEIFYPGVRDEIEQQDLLDEAEVEHETAKVLIAQISEMDAGDELFDARLTVLGEYINHHIDEEEKQLFPAVKSAKLDTKSLGQELQARKSELMEELDIEQPDQRMKATLSSRSRRKSTRGRSEARH